MCVFCVRVCVCVCLCVCVCVKVCIILSKHPARTPTEARTGSLVQVACTFFFAAESLVKLGAYGINNVRQYLSMRINAFDLILAGAAFFGFLVQGEEEDTCM